MENLRIVSGAEYNKPGFVIESLCWQIGLDPVYAIPAWEEMGLADLCGPFSTREQALAAIDEAF